MLCVVIKGPKQLCIDIDMCLELLMLGIETLWRVRVPMFDALRNKPITCISIIYLRHHQRLHGLIFFNRTIQREDGMYRMLGSMALHGCT